MESVEERAGAQDRPAAGYNRNSAPSDLKITDMRAWMRDFIALERDNVFLDLPWWQDLVTGIPKPIIQKGYILVPEKPGLGVELNEAVVKEHLRVPGYFEPTPQYDKYILDDYRPGGAAK